MTTTERLVNYTKQNGGVRLTARQRRRIRHKSNKGVTRRFYRES